MLFNSTEYMIFLPAVLLVYFVIPKKVKQLWLLAASYFFYMCWNAKYALLILASTVITYTSGILIERIKNSSADEAEKTKKKKWVVAFSLIINLGILFIFKYLNFAVETAAGLLSVFGVHWTVPQFDIILPVGISFYTFQALSYTIDVYRDEIRAEKNFITYALYVSFFPQLVAGPIERSKNLIRQLKEPKKFQFESFREGVLLMIWGFFLKIVIADRIGMFVDTVYGNYQQFGGYYLIVATILFAFQIYCDFAGYSYIAMGTAKTLGVTLTDNFNAPYYAVSITDFWRRWHISLSSWFRDYVYFPLGGNRRGTVRKQINKMIVFLLSGLWHGASLTYVVWGGINGLYQVIGDGLRPVRDKVVKVCGLHRESFGHKLFQVLFTFVLIDFSWIFFRARTISEAFEIIGSIFSARNPWILFDGSLYSCGLDFNDFWLTVVSLGVLLAADGFKRKGIVLRDKIAEQDAWFRIVFIALAILVLLVFGLYGPYYDAGKFIYFQF